MKTRLKIYGGVIFSLSCYIIIGTPFAYAWIVGIFGLLSSVFFGAKSLTIRA